MAMAYIYMRDMDEPRVYLPFDGKDMVGSYLVTNSQFCTSYFQQTFIVYFKLHGAARRAA